MRPNIVMACSKPHTQSQGTAPNKPCRRPKLFYVCGCSFITITHYLGGKVRSLPFPMGSLADSVLNKLGPWMMPLIGTIEKQALRVLTIMDMQLSLVQTITKHVFPPLNIVFEEVERLENFSSKLPDIIIDISNNVNSRGGIVGYAADLWAHQKSSVKNQINNIVLEAACKIPFLYFILDVVISVHPHVCLFSDCLLKQREIAGRESISENVATEWDAKDDSVSSVHHDDVVLSLPANRESDAVSNNNEHGADDKQEPLHDDSKHFNELGADDKQEPLHDDSKHFNELGADELPNEDKQEILSDEKKVFEECDATELAHHDDNQISTSKGQDAPETSHKSEDEAPHDSILELFEISWNMKPALSSFKTAKSSKS